MRNNKTIVICLGVLVVCVLVALAMDYNHKPSIESISDSAIESVSEISEEAREAKREIQDEVNDAMDDR